MNDTLSMEELERIWNVINPPLYYVMEDQIEPGQFVYVEAGKYFPEFFVCHPDDFEALAEQARQARRRLIDLRDYRMDKDVVIERVERELDEKLNSPAQVETIKRLAHDLDAPIDNHLK